MHGGGIALLDMECDVDGVARDLRFGDDLELEEVPFLGVQVVRFRRRLIELLLAEGGSAANRGRLIERLRLDRLVPRPGDLAKGVEGTFFHGVVQPGGGVVL